MSDTKAINTPLKTNKKRVQYFDIARGIAVLAVIACHNIDESLKRDLLMSFNIPAFLICSGFFYKQKSLWQELKTSITKLFIPATIVVFAVSAIGGVPEVGWRQGLLDALRTSIFCISNTNKWDFHCGNVGVIWFFYAIIAMRLVFWLDKKLARDNEWVLAGLVLMETYGGFLLGQRGYWMPWSFDAALACMLYIYVGYMMKKTEFLSKVTNNPFVLIACFAIWATGLHWNVMEIAWRKYPWGPWCYLTAICGVTLLVKLSQLIERYLKLSTAVLSWFGRNSEYIIFGHHVEWMLLKTVPNMIAATSLSLTIKKACLIVYKWVFTSAFAGIVLGFKKLFSLFKRKPAEAQPA